MVSPHLDFEFKHQPCRGVVFHSAMGLGEQSLIRLTELLTPPATPPPKKLAGRAPVQIITLDETGPVAVKTCCRGGWISRLNPHHYFRWKIPRARRELEFLCHARHCGVNVPRPVACITKGRHIHRAWVVTTAILPHTSFARLSMIQPEKGVHLLPKLSQQISCLMDAAIFHIDLHPGNVLVTPDQTLYLIDFDKACFFKGNRRSLAQQYQKRWTRAVHKHGLPRTIASLEVE